MGLFNIFKRKKQVVAPIQFDASIFRSTLNIFSDFGDNINASDIVKICIDRIATHSAKLKPRYVKTEDNETVQEKKGNLAYLLKFQPNSLMTPYDFIYKVVTLLYLNNNAFIYPEYDCETYELKAIWPLKPNSVEMLKDDSGAMFRASLNAPPLAQEDSQREFDQASRKSGNADVIADAGSPRRGEPDAEPGR